MIDALYIAASGLRSEQRQIDVISNNVANLQTPGFKRGRVNFEDVASTTVTNGPEAAPTAIGGGSRVASIDVAFEPGELRATQHPLDLAIDGTGFFELDSGDGRMVYTRDGRFRLDAEGYLTSVNGLRLTNGVQVPADASDLRISAGGEISAVLGGESERSVLGQIELVAFAAPDALTALGNSGFSATDAAGAPTYDQPGQSGLGSVRQGYMEMANVDMIDEMSTLVMAQRAYQLNARVLQASDQILETINNLRR